MNSSNAWWLGFLLIVLFVLFGELTIVFKDYFYARLGLNRDIMITALWVIPIVASFIAVYFSKIILTGLYYIPILSILGPLVHFAAGEFGVPIDFEGLEGLSVTVKLYVLFSVITVGLGSFLGLVLKTTKDV